MLSKNICLFICGLAVALLGCSSAPVTVPPVSGAFSNASLKGQYTFSLTGIQAQDGAYSGAIGSFTADGAGNITAGLEDILNLSTAQPASLVSFSGGSYSILGNGRGTITLQSATGSLKLSVALQSGSTGYVMETDLAAATSGTIHLQNAGQFSVTALATPYVFQLFGVTFVPKTASPISLIGEFSANGSGGITGGVMDTNNGNLSPSGATAIAASSYSLDPSNGATFGRGTMTFSGYTFAFYIIDSTHIVLLEEDALGGSAGDAYIQSGPVPTQNSQLSGNFVYLTNGLFTHAGQGPVVTAARFTADGSGNLTAITLDQNNSGNYTHLSQASNATYSIDAANSGSGRGTFTFTNSGNTYTRVFYMISNTQGVVEDTSSGIVGNGLLSAQTAGPFALSSLTGNFVFGWSGVLVGVNSAIPFEEDYVGQYALSNASSSNIAGATDYLEMGLSGSPLFTGIALGGTLSLNGNGTANNQYKFVVSGSPSVTVNFQAYFVNPSTVYVVTSDSTRTLSGIITQQ